MFRLVFLIITWICWNITWILLGIQNQVNCVTGPSFAAFLALKEIIVMWSLLVSSIGTPLEHAHLSLLNDI